MTKSFTIVRTIDLQLDPNRWELFTESFEAIELQRVADNINREISIAMNANRDRQQAWPICERVLQTYSHYGAADTEPYAVLHGIFNQFYPETD